MSMDNREHKEQNAQSHSSVSLLLVFSLEAKHYLVKEEEHKQHSTACPCTLFFWQEIQMSRKRWGHERKSGGTDKSKKSKAGVISYE